MKTIVLITCVAPKLNHRAMAKDLYQGPLFKKLLTYAASRSPDHQFILSGKYGLLDVYEVIAPYDVNLNLASDAMLQAWAKQVLEDLAHYADFEKDHFIVLANPTYAKYLTPVFSSYEMPMAID